MPLTSDTRLELSDMVCFRLGSVDEDGDAFHARKCYLGIMPSDASEK